MNGRFSRAYVLLLIATEELSKVRMLISWWDSSEVSEELLKKRMDLFRNHHKKLKGALLGLFPHESFRERWGMRGQPEIAFREAMAKVNWIQTRKNDGLYLAMQKDGFRIPEDNDYQLDYEQLKVWVDDIIRWSRGMVEGFIANDLEWYFQQHEMDSRTLNALNQLRLVLRTAAPLRSD